MSWPYLLLDDTSFVALVHQRVVVGRGAHCDVCVPSNRVSREHAYVTRDGDGWLLEDSGSTGGTFVGQPMAKIARHRLRHADRIVVGDVVLEFVARDEPLETDVTRALELDVAARPDDAATFAVWVDALCERGDPLGAVLAKRPVGPPTGCRIPRDAQLTWEGGLIRRAVITGYSGLLEVIRSRLGRHVRELVVNPGLIDAAVARRWLETATLPALRRLVLPDWVGPVPKLLHSPHLER